MSIDLKKFRYNISKKFKKKTLSSSVGVTAQAILSPALFPSLFDPDTGEFMVGAEIYFYEEDAVTLQDVYPSPDGTGEPYPNPLILNSSVAAMPPIYYQDAAYYIKIFADGATDPTYSFPYVPTNSSSTIIEVAQVDDMIVSSGQTLSATDVTQLSKAATNYTLGSGFFVDTGTANSYVGARDTGVLFDLPSQDQDMVFFFRPENTNTGASTLTIPLAGGGSISGPILNSSDGSQISAGQIQGGQSEFYQMERSKVNDCFYIKVYPGFSPAVNPGNYLINSNFCIWQRGSSFTIVASTYTYTTDRWRAYIDGGSLVVTQAGQSPYPGQSNSPYCVNLNRASTGGTNFFFEQPIENLRTLFGETGTFFIDYKNTLNTETTCQVLLIQKFGTGGSPSAQVDTVIGNITIAASGYGSAYFTFTLPQSLGTYGTNNDSTLLLSLRFDPTIVTNINIFNVAVYAGSSVVPYYNKPISEELIDCQRYYEASFFPTELPAPVVTTLSSGNQYNTRLFRWNSNVLVNPTGAYDAPSQLNSLGALDTFKIEKRVVPKVTWYGLTGAQNVIAATAYRFDAISPGPAYQDTVYTTSEFSVTTSSASEFNTGFVYTPYPVESSPAIGGICCLWTADAEFYH
jgi:hypothetical protein